MRRIGKSIASATAALAVMSSSMAGAASAQPVQATQQASNPWMTLSMMTPAGATALGAAGVAAQAPPDAPPPPPPPEGRDGRGIGHIPIPVLTIWLATIVAMIYIATHDDKDSFESPD